MTVSTAMLLNARELSWPGGLRYTTLVEQLQTGEAMYGEYRNGETSDVTTIPVDTEDDYRRFMTHLAGGSSNFVRFLAVKQYGRKLRLTTGGYADLIGQLRDGEILWGDYYWFSNADCMSSQSDRVPLMNERDYIEFVTKHWRAAENELNFWALTRQQEAWFKRREEFGYYSPFQEDPNRKTPRAARQTAPIVLTKDTAEAPLADQPTRFPFWVRIAHWAAGYPCH